MDRFLHLTTNAETLPKDTLPPRVQQQIDAVTQEMKGVFGSLDLYVDSSTSLSRKPEKGNCMATCLRPTHKVFSVTCNRKIPWKLYSSIQK